MEGFRNGSRMSIWIWWKSKEVLYLEAHAEEKVLRRGWDTISEDQRGQVRTENWWLDLTKLRSQGTWKILQGRIWKKSVMAVCSRLNEREEEWNNFQILLMREAEKQGHHWRRLWGQDTCYLEIFFFLKMEERTCWTAKEKSKWMTEEGEGRMAGVSLRT